jgi:hypothetical protein
VPVAVSNVQALRGRRGTTAPCQILEHHLLITTQRHTRVKLKSTASVMGMENCIPINLRHHQLFIPSG